MDRLMKTTWGRQKVFEMFRELEERYRTIVEWSPGATIIHRKGEILYVNPAALLMFGALLKEEMVGKNFIDRVLPEFHEQSLARVKNVIDSGGSVPMVEMRYLKLDGSIIDVEVQVVSIMYDGEQANYVKVIDISHRKKVERDLQKTLLQLRKTLAGTISVISKIVDMRDAYTSSHQKNVSIIAREIAQHMGLSAERVEDLRLAALIHDIGKITVPAEILSKPSELKDAEFQLIKDHVKEGFEALKDSELSDVIKQTVLQHHERLDGSGYPQGLKADEILLEAKILMVADIYDAMTSHRPYRASLGEEAALEEFEKNRGILYDETVVEALKLCLIEKKFKE